MTDRRDGTSPKHDVNNRVIVRFVGDPSGYATERWRVEPPTGWVPATVGRNGGKAVKINLAQAYVIEAYVPDQAVDL